MLLKVSSNCLALLLLSIMIVSCGMMQTVAVKSSAPILYNAAEELETESNWENFKTAVPGNLKLTEALLYLDQENEKLLASLVKGYAAYAYVVDETTYLEDYYADSANEKNREKAIRNYSRAIDYGIRFLEQEGISYQDLTTRVNEDNGIYNLLDDELGTSKEELEAILFLGLALGSAVNLQRNNMVMVAQLPIAKNMFDWVCSKDDKILFGMCDIFSGIYETSRPKMLGGDPEKGKMYFEKAIKDFPNNWLARVVYIQYYHIPFFDDKGYGEQKFSLEKALRIHNKDMVWNPLRKEKDESFSEKRLRLFQSLAIKRYETIKKYEKEIF